jgi:ADP-heptose:LPS heptosyltransferase
MPYKKILVLNLIPNTIGDNILLTPLISILKKKTRDAKIDFTVSSLNYPLFLNNPHLNKIFEIKELGNISERKRHKWSKLLTYLKIVLKYKKIFSKEKYDLCLVLLPNFPLNILIPKLAGIKEIAGFTYRGAYLSFFLTKKTQYRGIETKDYERHFIESYLDILRILKINFTKKDIACELFLTKEEEKSFSKILETDKLTKGGYICFQAGSKGNSWDTDNFRKLAKYILDKYPFKIVLLGSKEEFELNKKISDIDKRIINSCSSLSLREKAFLLKNSLLSVCNDSGLAHMSSAVGAKTIVLFGPHSPKHSMPLGKGKVYPIYKFYKEFPYVKRTSPEGLIRINKISPEEVFTKVSEVIRETK